MRLGKWYFSYGTFQTETDLPFTVLIIDAAAERTIHQI